jgi:hypothetical protein
MVMRGQFLTIKKPDLVRPLIGLLSPKATVKQCLIIARQHGGYGESITTNQQFWINIL